MEKRDFIKKQTEAIEEKRNNITFRIAKGEICPFQTADNEECMGCNKNYIRTECEKKCTDNMVELLKYIKMVFPNIENENAPFICSKKLYYTIEDLMRIAVWFHTDDKLFETKLCDWKVSNQYVEIFKKTIDFYRKEIYDKIPK